MGVKEQQSSMTGQELARRYDLDSTVRIFRSLQATSSLALPAQLRDVAETDPELLATCEAPANVLQLLAEPLHVTSCGGVVDEAGQVVDSHGLGPAMKHSLDPDLPEAVGTLEGPAVDQEPQPSASLSAGPRDEALTRAVPVTAAGHEQMYSYRDPSGVMQVGRWNPHFPKAEWCNVFWRHCLANLMNMPCLRRATSREQKFCAGTRMDISDWICFCAAFGTARICR